MLLDFEVQRCTRRCAATDRPFQPGDECYSVLEIAGADVIRKDYCRDGWAGPPERVLGWWRSRVPEPTAKKIKLAPNEVLLELFDQLGDQCDQSDLRYVLALLLIRRRVLRVEVSPELHATEQSHSGCDAVETMQVYCPKRETTYEVTVNMPGGARVEEIQQQLSELLIADAE